MAVEPIPEGYRTVTPYLVGQGTDKLLQYVKDAFGAEERMRMPNEDGSIAHAEVQIGDSVVMMGDASGEWEPRPSTLHLYVEDCDATYQKALDAGGDSVREPRDEFYGDRMAGVRDPADNTWWIATHVEDVSAEEMAKRASESAAQT